jgi:hypothetical protein
MSYLKCRVPGLEIKSLAKFLSCFGVIKELSIELFSSLLPTGFDVHDFDEIPIYHAREVIVNSLSNSDDGINAAFLVMLSCIHVDR